MTARIPVRAVFVAFERADSDARGDGNEFIGQMCRRKIGHPSGKDRDR
jgi:hypothetical protein